MPADLKTFLDRMAEEARPPGDAPPPMLRRARLRRARTAVATVTAVAVAAAGTVVAVRALQRPAPLRPAAQACAWEQVEVPSRAPLSTRVLAVHAVADDDVWAVGDAYGEGESGVQESVILHWDGTAWSEVEHPEAVSLTGVDAVAPDDVWAVGFARSRGVAMHWNGTMWVEEVAAAEPGPPALWDVAAVSADDVWAVGNAAGGGSGTALVEHWDGNVWSTLDVRSPEPDPKTADPSASLEAVSASSSGDLWAVGQTANVAPAGSSNAIAARFDGDSWTVERLADVPAEDGLPYTSMFDVAVTGSDEVWAVGIAASEPGFGGRGDRALIERRDPEGWQVVETLPADSRLFGITETPDGGLVAVGSIGVSGSFQPLVLVREGDRWVRAEVPGRGQLSAIAATPGGELWAVGSGEQGGGLALRCR